MIVAEMYAGLLYGEQTDASSAEIVSAPKESEWEVKLVYDEAGDGVTNIMPKVFGTSYWYFTLNSTQHCKKELERKY